ncbi:MAG: hypothetical protein Q8R53_01385 [Nanoarchaeota archaeon]|nr:hypothetical protein [Nanoarchaeota archaeon]
MVLLTLTGESGTGKSTIARHLLASPDFSMVTSTTTRKPRASDLPNEYAYVSPEQFFEIEKAWGFIWTAPYAGNYYGTKYSAIDTALCFSGYQMMILVPQVLPILFSYTKNVEPFFIRTPPREVLEQRLRQRGDSPEDIARRLQNAGQWEAEAAASGVPYCFIANEGPIEQAVGQILSSLGKP